MKWDFLEGWWEYYLKGLVQDFIDGIDKLEDLVIDFCMGAVGFFPQAKPTLDPSVDGKKEFSRVEFIEGNLIAEVVLVLADK
jgi:hypothetical protein